MKPGDVFSRLTVLRLIPHKKNPKAECLCVCGSIVTPQRGALRNGRAKSCGCYRKEVFINALATHGQSKTPEYSVFRGMIQRCTNPNDAHYRNYGGRGIKVEYASFEDFLADVGPRPEGTWIERKNNELGYSSGNCIWVLPNENQKNKRVSKIWVIGEKVFESSVEAAAEIGVTPSVIVRGCNGYTRHGKYNPPRHGWSCFLKYPDNVPIPDTRRFDA